MRIAVAVMTAVLLSGPMHAQSTDPTAALLSQLIRVNTSNPPGMTQGIADLLAPRFRAAGFTVDVIATPDSAKVHFIARLKGDSGRTACSPSVLTPLALSLAVSSGD